MRETAGLLLLLSIFAWIILTVVALFCGMSRQFPRKRFTFVAATWLIVTCPVVGLFAFLVYPFSPVGVPQLVAYERVGEFEFMLTQTFTPSTEPYEVYFYYRKNQGPWSRHYMDHEAWYWRGALQVKQKDRLVEIINHGRLRATFNFDTLRYDHLLSNRYSIGPQWILTKGHPLDPETITATQSMNDLVRTDQPEY